MFFFGHPFLIGNCNQNWLEDTPGLRCVGSGRVAPATVKLKFKPVVNAFVVIKAECKLGGFTYSNGTKAKGCPPDFALPFITCHCRLNLEWRHQALSLNDSMGGLKK